ncbi:cell wall hydrolase [Novosphingobium mangrovi (ex Huang et al. 2023)]|uniref:Cell wall hydrolase n=1 Tax=Novosphingobium mangrovi (ex Huang et al. 2023) TaxID=2976432 RepID=A0ABT2I9W6_9SPHN|nr:cell wall hydrolase [Novosphingobium mangrovi (ex Huang et al. 2023)]MCT2401292.1 cell wall hydrolase [Novosphingobium mangrovi (ex Huang et al. 2023)]
MRTKVQWASAIALAATVSTALLSVQGSGAAASEMNPIKAIQESPVKFVSEPVVQPLAAEEGQGAADNAADAGSAEGLSETRSLAQLVSEQALPETLGEQMRCLAGAVYFEARGETLEGQLAVARVIVNRAASDRFPDSYCGVVYQRSQFSFVRGGAMPSIRKNSRGWHRAVAIARIARDGMWASPAQGALFFHAARVSPNWRLTRVGRVDNHIFYR